MARGCAFGAMHDAVIGGESRRSVLISYDAVGNCLNQACRTGAYWLDALLAGWIGGSGVAKICHSGEKVPEMRDGPRHDRQSGNGLPLVANNPDG